MMYKSDYVLISNPSIEPTSHRSQKFAQKVSIERIGNQKVKRKVLADIFGPHMKQSVVINILKNVGEKSTRKRDILNNSFLAGGLRHCEVRQMICS